MKIEMTVEYDNPTYASDDTADKWLILDVTFEGFPSWDNDSFDYSGTHCTGGVGGTHRSPSYPSMADSSEVTWNKEKFTPEENHGIETWLKKESEYVDEMFCLLLEKESE